MIVLFHSDAREEFLAATDYYEAAVSGLGERFLAAVRRTFDLLVERPDAGAKHSIVRRRIVPGFPYDVVYRVRGEILDILAIAHHRRRPGYWRGRTRA